MADEILSRDGNRVAVLGGVTDDSAQELRALRVDPTTGRLEVSATIDGVPTAPTSSTDNAIARFDGTSGSALQNSGITISDSNVMAVPAQYYSARYDAGNSGTSKTLDWNNGNCQLLTLTGNVTLTLSNPAAGGRYLLELLQDGTGSRTVTFPAAVKWSGASAPTLTTTAGRTDIVTLYYNGTSYAATSTLNFAL